MPRHRAGVRYASGQSTTSVRFIDTRGEPTLGIVVCQRCWTKRRQSDVMEDGNIKSFYVCKPEISPGCYDQYDPFREPAPPPDRIDLPFVRPDTDITINPDGLPPLQPPMPTPVPPPVVSGQLLAESGADRVTESGALRVIEGGG